MRACERLVQAGAARAWSISLTGATGFTGSHLAAGWPGLATRCPRWSGRAASIARAAEEERIHIRVGDLSDAASVERAAAGCGQFVIIAATYREPGTDTRTAA